MEIVERPAPPTGLRRRLWRLPIRLYRMGLGPLLGRRIMLLTHTGRVSGLPRQVVIEVVQKEEDGYVAASGFGPRADWYRNVMATPEVTIQVAGTRTQATAAPIATDEGAEIMARYAVRHPSAARRLCKLMGFAVDGSTEDYREVGRHIPFVRFTKRPAAAA
ncbi:nitroreductase family deazaflavin-dependent oxidoreductase [Actinomadura sp. NAK00032]|uniref:nitroreductase family deazaflavin-dependent oxidoreductase n=1 Tax=Actinomadura sp. NAK00032 TaxID=2742128 RepID=UPI00159155FB|nr:nitroreductase family deazaflavin-dependent oxidoreductase [Actinomadura sp. NAK00032]QKW37314.1 nitroreductase family deazaflavin-dependent oxidoreductase [Actinomadura sp. NAK00032]